MTETLNNVTQSTIQKCTALSKCQHTNEALSLLWNSIYKWENIFSDKNVSSSRS